jgi:LacI family transcriptional regulator/LacI family purine nucleotide synthesis repressor
MKKRRVTLQAVAERAGVNRVTAAVALGKSPQGGTRVSQATRLRVQEAAQELGYAPNAIAQALRGERTNIVGYYAGYEALDAHSPFTAAIMQGLQRSCRNYNQDLLIFGSFIRDTVDSIYATLTSGKIDGLILLPTPRSPVMDRLFDSHLPVVAVANSHPNAPSVIVDDADGSRMLAEYLAQQGHRHILYRGQAELRTSSINRQAAFCTTAKELGLEVTLTREGPVHHELTAEEMAILQRPAHLRPTAAVCWMDISAYVLLDYCEEIGLAVPDELAIAGFDGVPLNIAPKRVLTTIRAPWADVAAQAVEYLQWLLAGKEVPAQTVFPVRFSAGDTA